MEAKFNDRELIHPSFTVYGNVKLLSTGQKYRTRKSLQSGMQHFAIWEKVKIRRRYREKCGGVAGIEFGHEKPERFDDRSG
jgi:hypothetical protein